MAKEVQDGKTSKKGSISEGTVKKGSVNTAPTTNRPKKKPAGQGGSSSGSGKKK